MPSFLNLVRFFSRFGFLSDENKLVRNYFAGCRNPEEAHIIVIYLMQSTKKHRHMAHSRLDDLSSNVVSRSEPPRSVPK
ncbi:hypothetical protein QR680_017728 [Steinernema hermaphroditum]|uniref:Uncharacterized protein n=1 Tax=Steinernema hermaphroditum TaxID=289476 RepID=A0AA39HFL2_9BILA|nr:hypothetical protein QR680_017728 [Steinernema hermaphroditum]